MAFPDPNEPSVAPSDDLELINALIARKESGEPVDADILALLRDMEQVGLTDTEAYAALDAYRPGSTEAEPERDEASIGPKP